MKNKRIRKTYMTGLFAETYEPISSHQDNRGIKTREDMQQNEILAKLEEHLKNHHGRAYRKYIKKNKDYKCIKRL